MILFHSNGKAIPLNVAASLRGQRTMGVVLDKQDVGTLLSLSDREVRQWLLSVYVTYQPSETQK